MPKGVYYHWHMFGENNPKYRKNKGKENPMYGKQGWNKGLTKEIDERLLKIGKSISKGQKQNWDNNPERKEKLSKRMKGYRNSAKSPEVREKIRQTLLKLHKNPEYRKKFLEGRKKSRESFYKNKARYSNIEVSLFAIILDLSNNFIHNSKEKAISIYRKKPDFINITEHKIIELFGDYWHRIEKQVEKDKQKIDLFKKVGFEVLVIWERELKNKPKLIRTIKLFLEI